MAIIRKTWSKMLGTSGSVQPVEGETVQGAVPSLQEAASKLVQQEQPSSFETAVKEINRQLDYIAVLRLIEGLIQRGSGWFGRLLKWQDSYEEAPQAGDLRMSTIRTDGYFINTDINGLAGYMWIDADGYARRKIGTEPVSDTDGSIVGPIKNYRQGCDVVYKSATAFTTTAGTLDINGITKTNDVSVDYSIAANSTLDQQQTTQDTGKVLGRTSSVMYVGQGFTPGTAADGKLHDKVQHYLWKSGSPADNVKGSLRSSITGADLATVTVAGSSVGGAVGSSATDQSYSTATTNGTQVRGSQWRAQTFTPSVSGPRVSCDLKLLRSGNPTGNVEVSLRDLTDNVDLANASMAASSVSNSVATVYTFTWDVSPYFLAGTEYRIAVRVPNGDASNFVYMIYDPGASYSGGSLYTSSNSGSTWAISTGNDAYFVDTYAPATFTYIDFGIPGYELTAGEQLYFTATRTGAADAKNNYVLGANSAGGYAGAQNYERYSADGIAWTDETGVDLTFKTYYRDATPALWEGPLVNNSWYFVWATPQAGQATGWDAVITRLSQPTGVTATVLTDSGANWTVDKLIGSKVGIVAGTGSVNWYTIVDNTAATITVDAWVTTPSTDSYYMVQPVVGGHDARSIGQLFWSATASGSIYIPSVSSNWWARASGGVTTGLTSTICPTPGANNPAWVPLYLQDAAVVECAATCTITTGAGGAGLYQPTMREERTAYTVPMNQTCAASQTWQLGVSSHFSNDTGSTPVGPTGLYRFSMYTSVPPASADYSAKFMVTIKGQLR